MNTQARLLTVACLSLVAQLADAQTASCPTGTQRQNQTQINAQFTNNTLCVRNGTIERWQEYHKLGGDLIDWKTGSDTHPVDPRKKVGTWRVDGTGSNATLAHVYDSTYSWLVCQSTANAANYTLVSTGTSGSFSGSVLAGQVACP